MKSFPNEIILKIMTFLGNKDDIHNIKIATKEELFELSINKLIEYISSKSVSKINSNLLVEVTPRRKISFMVKNSVNKSELVRDLFFNKNNDYLIDWIQAHEN